MVSELLVSPMPRGSRPAPNGTLEPCSSRGRRRPRLRRAFGSPKTSLKRRKTFAASLYLRPIGSTGSSGSAIDDGASQNVNNVGGQDFRHVFENRRGDEHLLVAHDRRCQPPPPRLVELGENIVKNQNRVAAGGIPAQQLGGCELERERERPRFTMARVALGGEIVEHE